MVDNDMTTAEREEAILEFMVEHGLALPLTPIYENLKRERDITFSKRTVKRRLESLQEDGYMRRLEIGRGYWEVTDEGRAYVAGMDADD